jgi:hypothetical protein
MSRRGFRLALLTFAAATLLPSVASGHEAVKALVDMTPGLPRAGETCVVEVTVLAPPGVPVLEQIQGVRLTGEMTGHAMTPVEADLAPVAGRGGYTGRVALTMGGPWQFTIRIKVANEEMWATFPVEAVRADQTGDPVGLRHIVEMRDPVRANVLPPWQVVGWTMVLIVVFESAAAGYKWRHGRSGSVPATN